MKRKNRSSEGPAKKKMPDVTSKTITASSTPGKGKRFQKLEIANYSPSLATSRLLSCGEGDQIGHPGRDVTRKPRMVDTFPNGTKFLQAAAGGVHSVVLTTDGVIYSCGVNEKGTVPVKGLPLEEMTKKFTKIQFSPAIEKLGKPVQIAAGASFAAMLTEKGSVIAWGNMRDSQGEVTVHETLSHMQKEPVVVIRHTSKVIVKIEAGENHLAMLSNDSEILTFGEGSVGQLGRSVRTEHIRSSYMVDDSGRSLVVKVRTVSARHVPRFIDVFACGFWTIGKAVDGRVFACGQNNFCQLGITTVEDAGGTTSSDGGDVNATATPTIGQEKGNIVRLLTHTTAFPESKNWTHIAGVHHIACRNDDGEVWTIGKNTDNALGLGTWTGNDDDVHWRYNTLQKVTIPSGEPAAGVTASMGTSIVWTEDGKCYAFGCDTTGQLGLGLKEDEDDKIVPTPQLVHSAHLDGHRVVSVSLSDNHALFLAVEDDDYAAMKKNGVNA